MTAIIYTGNSIDSCKLHTIFEVKVKVLATVVKSKPIRLAAWEFCLAIAQYRSIVVVVVQLFEDYRPSCHGEGFIWRW